jgi:hypothetical protein
MKKLEPVIVRLNNYITMLEGFKNEMVERAERLAVELAFILTETLVLKECEEDKETIIRMAKRQWNSATKEER